MADTRALRHVLDGYRADIARRAALIRNHQTATAELVESNRIDADHAAVAAALIAQIDASDTACAPATEMEAAALVASQMNTPSFDLGGQA